MKLLFLAGAGLLALTVVLGSPFAEMPAKGNYFDAPEPILPMAFAHVDHRTENCISCHHDYVDGTTGANGLCMSCHVTEASVWPLLETQFHDLCRGCHEEKAALGEDAGPPRQCIACHTLEDQP